MEGKCAIWLSRWLKRCPETGRKPPPSTYPALKAPESCGKEARSQVPIPATNWRETRVHCASLEQS